MSTATLRRELDRLERLGRAARPPRPPGAGEGDGADYGAVLTALEAAAGAHADPDEDARVPLDPERGAPFGAHLAGPTCAAFLDLLPYARVFMSDFRDLPHDYRNDDPTGLKP